MSFPFTYICNLLQQLDDELHSSKKERTPSKIIIANWFDSHRSRLNSPNSNASAVLSTLLPERRKDRVYNIQVAKLQGIFGRAHCLGRSRVSELERHLTPGSNVDLGDCIESVLSRSVSSRSN